MTETAGTTFFLSFFFKYIHLCPVNSGLFTSAEFSTMSFYVLSWRRISKNYASILLTTAEPSSQIQISVLPTLRRNLTQWGRNKKKRFKFLFMAKTVFFLLVSDVALLQKIYLRIRTWLILF